MLNSIFHFNLSCLEKNYDLILKAAKKLQSIIFKFSIIFSSVLAIEGIIYRFYNIIFTHRESVAQLKGWCLLEKKKFHRFIKPQWLNLSNFQPGQLLSNSLSFDLNLSLSP